MDSRIVIKVKYEEILRRFSARIAGGELDLNIDALRKKIIGLFKFTPDTEFVLTYVDEDNDVVTLADDEDLRDVVRQALNPLRITVKLSNEKSGWSSARTSGSSTPLRSPRVEQPSLNLNSNVGSKTVPRFAEVCTDLPSTGTFPDQFFAFLVRFLSNIKLPCTNQLSDFQAGASTSVQGGVPGCTTNVTASLDAESSKADGAESNVLSSVGSENPSSRCKEVLPNYRSNGSEPKNDKENSANANGGVKALARQVPVLESVKTALDATNPKPPHTVQTDVSEKKEVDRQSGEHRSSGNFMGFPSFSVPPVSSSATANKKDVSDKPNESSGTKSNNVPDFTIYPSKVMWIEEPIGGEKNAFQTCEHMFSGNFMDFPSFRVPPLSSTATANNKKISDKPNESSGTKSNNAHDFTICPSKVMWFEESIGGAKNAFQTGLGNSSCINLVPSPVNECPFTGIPLDSPAVAPQLPPRVVQPRMSHGFSDGPQCDGCGVHPITGPRFKSKVKDDYDLCSMCFTQTGNENDYTRIDRPVAYRHPSSFKGLYDLHNRLHPPSQPPVFRCGAFKKPVRPKLDSRFIQDVNFLDGTVMAPSTPFTKIWRMRNNGSVVWPQGTQLVWIGGDKLSDVLSVQIEIASAGIPVDQELDVVVDFVAPDRPGRYISNWRMASPSGQKFGQRVWVLIQVDASSEELLHEGFRGFNLNLPPVSNGILGPETINVTPEPDSLPEVDNSNGAMKLVEPMSNASPEKEQEVNFPITDTLLVGGIGAISSPVPAAPSSSGSCPINYMSEVAPVLPVPLPPVTVVQTSAQDVKVGHVQDSHLKYVKEKSEVEETLLKDLEEMGFKQVDLNKEILRLNQCDLEKSVDDLCGVAGWDPILEELHDMGFYDKSTNQKLLKKNNGSIKRVVMDLIAEEQ